MAEATLAGLTLQGQVVVVTGAAQGIGRAMVARIVSLGGRAVAIDLNADGLDRLVADFGGEHVAALPGDVVDPALGKAAVRLGVERFGAISGLVNNAGVTRTAMIEKMTDEQWQTVVDVHLTAAFRLTQAVGRHLVAAAREQGGSRGAIVNISSDAGRRGTIGQINYAAAKAGVLGLTMSAAREWGRYGIRVNSVGFGVVETPMTETIRSEKFRDTYLSQIPLGRFGTPDEVAWPVCFLLSDAASYITGQHLFANGGWTIGL